MNKTKSIETPLLTLN